MRNHAAILIVAASAATVAANAITTNTLREIAERPPVAPRPVPPAAFAPIDTDVRIYRTTTPAEALRLYREERALEAKDNREARETAIREEKTT